MKDPARYTGGFVPELLYVMVCQKIGREVGIMADDSGMLALNILSLIVARSLVSQYRWRGEMACSQCNGREV